jgi:uncharacterized protein (DUF924 family)
MHPSDILSFWRDAGEERWWTKSDAFDQDIRARFMPLWEQAAAGRLDHWIETDEGTLALVIVLDQFPRNMFRNDARAFSTDAKACGIAHAAIESGVDCRVAPDLRQFLYLPLMHSEKLADQERCVNLFAQLDNEKNTQYALVHAQIIRKFGRFPHRNPVLGRVTTPEEQAFLDSGGFSG